MNSSPQSIQQIARSWNSISARPHSPLLLLVACADAMIISLTRDPSEPNNLRARSKEDTKCGRAGEVFTTACCFSLDGCGDASGPAKHRPFARAKYNYHKTVSRIFGTHLRCA